MSLKDHALSFGAGAGITAALVTGAGAGVASGVIAATATAGVVVGFIDKPKPLSLIAGTLSGLTGAVFVAGAVFGNDPAPAAGALQVTEPEATLMLEGAACAGIRTEYQHGGRTASIVLPQGCTLRP